MNVPGHRLAAVLLAVCAAAGVVLITLATRQTPSQPKPIAGKPPIPTTLTTPASLAKKIFPSPATGEA